MFPKHLARGFRLEADRVLGIRIRIPGRQMERKLYRDINSSTNWGAFGGRSYPSNAELYWLGLVEISIVQLPVSLYPSQ